MKTWMKALVWLGLGGGIGFFAGYQVGRKGTDAELRDIQDRIDRAKKRNNQIEKNYGVMLDHQRKQHELEIASIRERYEEALDAQREYLGGKDDEVISEGQTEMDLDEDMDEDIDVMDEVPEMPEEVLTDEDEEIQPFHPEDLRPFAISASEYLQNEKGYDQVELDYYTEDGVIFDPHREEKWTHPEQLLGLGWKAMFISTGKPVREGYVQNDTMENLYKITRIDDSFERLYEEE